MKTILLILCVFAIAFGIVFMKMDTHVVWGAALCSLGVFGTAMLLINTNKKI